MDTNIHNVTSIKVGEPEYFEKNEFWTREIVVRTKEGHTFKLTLFTQEEDKEGIEITL